MSGIRVCPKCHGHNSECYHCGGGGTDTPDRPLNVIRPARKKSATDQDLERKRRRTMNDPKALAEGLARLVRLEQERLSEERAEQRRLKRAKVRTWPWWKRVLYWIGVCE